MSKKKDTGIATLANGVQLPEATRDLLLKHNWQEPRRKQEGFDPNSCTTAELKEHKFSGFRVNVFTQDLELWCLGDMVTRRRARDCTPGVVASMHEEAFATAGSIIEFDLDEEDKRRLRRKQARRKQ